MSTLRESLARGWDYVARRWRHLTGEWKPLLEEAVPSAELDVIMRQASIPSWGFFFMLVLSSAIATFGLLSNSAPAIIGAMIIAPLMAPIIGFSYGIIILEWRQISRSILTLISGAGLVVLFAYFTTIGSDGGSPGRRS